MTEPSSSTQPWTAPIATVPVRATVRVPGSKSETARALVLAGLADGPSTITNALDARDTRLMRAGLRALGVRIDDGEDHDAAVWTITPPEAFTAGATIDCGLAGTVMRFLPPVAALAAGRTAFDGDDAARTRPMAGLLDGLADAGARVEAVAEGVAEGLHPGLPFAITGRTDLPGGVITIDAAASSQFVSGLLLVGARMAGGLDLRHVSEIGAAVPSAPNIAMTVAHLRQRGVEVDDSRPDRWIVAPGRIGARDVTIGPDLANAAPFLAAAAVTGGRVTVPDWPDSTDQPGDRIQEVLALFGAEVVLGADGLTVTGTDRLHGVDLDLSDASELTPVVAVLAALADHTSHLHGVAHIRGHETDRLAALATDLEAVGARVHETADGLTIHPKLLRSNGWLTYADHRMAHAGAVLGLVIDDIVLDDIGCVDKTMPDFPQLWARMLSDAVDADEELSGLVTTRVIGEDDHARFERPGRRSRPRTKDRPDYSDAEIGVVVTIDRGRYTLRMITGGARSGSGAGAERQVSATKARQLGRKGVIVGDRVRVVGDTSGDEGTLARIVEVTERVTVLRRTADDDDPYERPIVANAEQLVIVTALADPPPRTGMIDRVLVAGYDAGLEPLLCLTKSDLADPDELVAAYAPLDVTIVVTRPGADLTELQDRLAGRVSVFVGHSGVGKSTLVNALIPGADRAIGHVNEVTGRGRQTSTAAIALRLPVLSGRDGEDPGWVIDTPGVRSFGLSHVTRDGIIAAFGDLSQYTADCPRGCGHGTEDPECGLDAAVARGELSAARLSSFRRMITSGH